MPQNHANLKEWRKLNGWRQEDLADKLEEPRGTYQAWESARAAFPPEIQMKIRKLGYTGPFPEPAQEITLSDLESIREEIRSQAVWLREESRKETARLAAAMQEVLLQLRELLKNPADSP
jgi:transcriptional regulator with XRE-family HTH domain